MFSRLALAATLLATTTLAQNALHAGSVLRADDVLSKPYASLISFSEESAAVARDLEERAAANSSIPSDVKLLPNGSLDFTAWNNLTDAACKQRLSTISRTSNPSGDCICYNLPMLDVTTGMFEADLRLYRISAPRDDFVGVPPSEIQVGVVYSGASVTPMKPANSTSGSSSPSVNVTKRADTETSSPTLLQSYMLVGQIDKDKMQKNLSIADLEALVLPTLTLSADTPNGRISSNVSLNEAVFLVGVFSTDVVLSDFAAAQLAVTQQHDALKNGTVAFILPGVNILIFPVGLIVTSVWLAIGLAAYGLGTYERIQHVAAYKRRAVHASRDAAAYRTF